MPARTREIVSNGETGSVFFTEELDGDAELLINDIESLSLKCDYHCVNEILTSNKNELGILHCNIRSLPKNYDKLQTLLNTCKTSFDVICLSETWLHSSLVEGYTIPGYKLVNSCLDSHTRGKGAGIMIKDSLDFRVIKELTIARIEYQCTFVEITLDSTQKITIGCVYRSPSYHCELLFEQLASTIPTMNKSNKRCYIAGDWNIDLLNRENSGDAENLNLNHALAFN